jgi:hypothetical protein
MKQEKARLVWVCGKRRDVITYFFHMGGDKYAGRSHAILDHEIEHM